MGQIVPAKFMAWDSNGDPLSGGKVFFYEVGTSTKKTTYSDSGLVTPNTNPVILNSRGEASIFGTGLYKVVLAPADDTDPPTSPIWTMDNMYVSGASFLKDADEDTQIQLEKSADEDIIRFVIAGTEQLIIDDGKIEPTTDNDVDIGSSSKQIKDVYVEGKIIQNALEQKSWVVDLASQSSVSFTVDTGKIYELLYHCYLSASGAVLELTFNSDTGAFYNWARHGKKWESAAHTDSDVGQSADDSIILTPADIDYMQTGRILIGSRGDDNTQVYIQWIYSGFESTSIIGSGTGSARYDGASNVTTIQFKTSSGTFVSGKAILRQLS